MAFAFACNPCSTADPTQDTVKVSFPSPVKGKENVVPEHNYQAEQKAKEQADEWCRIEARRLTKAAHARAEAEAAETARQAETKRQAAEVAHRRMAEAEATARAARAEAATRAEAERQEEQLILAEQAAVEEAAAAAAAEATRREAAEKKAAAEISEFLTSLGFKGDVNSKRSSMLKHKYPLHIAVKEQNVQMVRLLLSAGADKSLKNSSGKTPGQKAEQYSQHKKGDEASAEVLLALGC